LTADRREKELSTKYNTKMASPIELNRQQLRHLENSSLEKTALKFLAGGLSATLITSALNSADHVKTRLQIQTGSASSGLLPYSSFSNTYVRVYREEGLSIVCFFACSWNVPLYSHNFRLVIEKRIILCSNERNVI
jgi:hypothetical protein